MEVLYTSTIDTDIGLIQLASTEQGLAYVGLPQANGRGFEGWLQRHASGAERIEAPEANREAEKQIREFLAGRRLDFDLPLDLRGTDFECKVYSALMRIPYGSTRSYLDVAKAIGKGKAMRAVGSANGANPVPLVIPCHRVVRSGGKLGGYAGGTRLKARLLAMESSLSLSERLL